MKRFFGKVDLFAPLLGDIEALFVSFDFDLKRKNLKKKKNLPARTYSKKVVEDNQTIIFLGLRKWKMITIFITLNVHASIDLFIQRISDNIRSVQIEIHQKSELHGGGALRSTIPFAGFK